MKKLILVLSTCIVFLGCSSNDESSNTSELSKNLIGSWKVIGYYTDVINPETGTNYYPTESETNDKIEFKSDSSIFSHLTNNVVGIYSVSQDSIITLNFNSNANNPNTSYSNKITLLTNQFLELSAVPDTGAISATERFEKVN